MDELIKLQQKASEQKLNSITRLIDTQIPNALGSQKRSKEYVVLSDPVSWSLNNQVQNLPGSTSTIHISNKGILDLKKSYIEFIVNFTNAKIISPVSFWEVTSWQIGSNLQVQLPYHQPLNESMFYRKEREEISRDGIACDDVFLPFSGANAAAQLANIGQAYVKYQIPLSALCQQFEEMEHLFVSLGQPLQIQLRLRQANECLVFSGAGTYTVGRGRLILSYVEMDQSSMDKVVRSKIQFLMPHHQVIPLVLAPVLNMSFSINRKDFIRYLVITSQQKSANTAPAATDKLGTQTYISGVMKPRLPIRRLNIVLGQQQLVIQSTGIDDAAQNHLGDLNLSDFPYLFQHYNKQQMFSPFIVDLTRFGMREDAWGSQVETQTLLVQAELEIAGKLPSPFTGDVLDNALNANVQVFGYLCYANQVSVENGLYKRD